MAFLSIINKWLTAMFLNKFNFKVLHSGSPVYTGDISQFIVRENRYIDNVT